MMPDDGVLTSPTFSPLKQSAVASIMEQDLRTYNMPKASIITPCYNSAKFIGKTITSVRAQTFADWEHIVVDDGSTDGSAEAVSALLAEEPRLRLLRKPNGGVASARNAGFRDIGKTSAYLLFLDADDMLEPAMLATLTDYLDAHQEVGMVYCTPLLIDEQDQEIPESVAGWTRYVPTRWGVRALRPQEPETPFLSILGLTTIIPSITLFRRSVYERTPQWDETFGHIFEDADLFLQVALRSKVHVLPQRLVRYRRHASQSTASAARYHAQEQKLFAKWRAMPGLTPEQQAMVCAAWRFREGRLLPAMGMAAASRCLRAGKVGAAMRFLAGAVRRYVVSLVEGAYSTAWTHSAESGHENR